jgi:O-antigen/teichoic acid export membrane protein
LLHAIRKLHGKSLQQPTWNLAVFIMSENIIYKLIKQVSVYFSSSVIITLAGFITFPIWTRVFTEAEYGKMSLAIVTLGLVVIISKFGIQNAALRFYSEFKENKRNLDFTYFYTSSFLSILFISLFTALIFLLIVEFYPVLQFDQQYLKIFRIIPLLIIFESLIDIFLLFLRAEQNVKSHSIFRIARRYSKLVITLSFVLVFKLGLTGFFIGCALSDGLFSVILGIKYFQQGKIKLKSLSLPLIRESISYGLPLIGLEISALLLTAGDRFLLQYFLGSQAVGLYSASTNMVKYLVDFFAESLKLAVMPLFMSIWDQKGMQETRNFLSTVSRIYFMLGIPIIFAVAFIGRDMLILIASKKFEGGYVILPFIVIGYVIHKANFLFGAGLYLAKKTKILSIIIFSSAIINIILNIILIPLIGLLGAAITTLIAFLIEASLLILISSRTVNFKLGIPTLLKYVAISIVMVIVMLNINNHNSMQILVRMTAGFLTYLCGILILENQIRSKAAIAIAKVFAK